MSELYYYLHQRPKAIEGSTPVHTRGNWFRKGDRRFLIKGISYLPRESDGKHVRDRAPIDPLSDEWLPQLRQDIPLFQQLGVNTISISNLDPRKSHGRALSLLQAEGIHVLIELLRNFQPLSKDPLKAYQTDYSSLNLADLYTTTLLKRNLAIIDQTADHPNVLGYNISGHKLNQRPALRLASVIRAAVRDIKHYVRLRAKRPIPVGVVLSDILDTRRLTLDFFTADEPEERVDFYSFDCFSWAGENSSFQISGWSSIARYLGNVPVPMVFSAYGTAITKRVFKEVDCLYSPDMTGVVSGGVVYTYAWGAESYNVVDIDGEGRRMRNKDFWFYKERLDAVARRGEEELVGQHAVKDYEGWRGNVAGQLANQGLDLGQVPACPVDLEAWSQASAHSA